MYEKMLRLKNRCPVGVTIACLLAGSFFALRIEAQTVSPLDKWAGKPVLDGKHVSEMVSKRLHNAPKVGEMAPPLTLTNVVTGKPTSLAELHAKKPVVLYFTSYSCTTGQESVREISELSKRFSEIAEFVLVYIQEAHPAGGFPPPFRGDPWVVEAQSNFADRAFAAIQFGKKIDGSYLLLADTIDDASAVRWGAWPLRLFVVDTKGIVVYAGQQGPWFFKPTATFDPNLPGVPVQFGSLAGYSRVSLEHFLLGLLKAK